MLISIISLRHGFETLSRLASSMDYISQHTFKLAQYFYNQLSCIRHYNGQTMAIIYGDTDYTERARQGAIVNFNLRRSDGSYIGFAEVCGLNVTLFKIAPTTH